MDACVSTAINALMPPVFSAEDADSELVRLASRGDVHSFEQLYRRHVARIHGVVLRLLGYDHARAEDVVQEAFLRAWQKLGDFRRQSTFATWMYRLAVNCALMSIRAAKSDPVAPIDLDAIDERGDTPFCPAERAELEASIGHLPPRARAVLVLHDVEGWRHQDIGLELGMAVGTSKAQLHRARRLLRQALDQRGVSS